MIRPTAAQELHRATGRKYRLILAPEGWGKTYMLAYDALWYARFPNKRVLVITSDVNDFNQALSSYTLLEHDTSNITVATEYQPGDWFMVIIDSAETYTEVQIKNFLVPADNAELVWISARTPAKTHWLYQLMLSKRADKHTKNRHWWVVVGEKHESYQENAKQPRDQTAPEEYIPG